MRGKIVLGSFILSIVILVVALQIRHEGKTPDTSASISLNSDFTGTPPSENISDQAVSSSSRTATTTTFEAPPDPQFQHWIREEAKSLDEPNVNGQAKEAEIRAIVSKINSSQAQQLRQTVNSRVALPREKILSAYLLVEGGLNTRQALKDSITAPLVEQGGEAHSESEIKGVREKSLRIMMIDGLYAQAKTDTKARETLAQAIADSEDPYIKAYAQEKLDQLQSR
ncbi:MAG: hypothetical protein HC883_02115 [Bdellovibrionaceae bacterium]|nr:hypothetical protein [Pseudobdellovibrionaceae bacterium]